MDFSDFIKPELFLLIPILMGIGAQLKAQPHTPDWLIPIILDVLGVLFAGLYVAATAGTDMNVWMAIFTGATQGLLCSLAAIGVNQTVKQTVQKR